MSDILTDIPRELDVPELSAAEISIITKIVFYAPAAEPSDLIFVFSNSRGDWQGVASLYASGYAPLILASGHSGRSTELVTNSEASRIEQDLISYGVPEAAILIEEESTNTLENVVLSKRLLESRAILPVSILYVCLNGHSGRCYLTLKKHFPKTKLTAWTYYYEGMEGVGANNWMHHSKASRKVYAEYQRIIAYSGKGDITQPVYD